VSAGLLLVVLGLFGSGALAFLAFAFGFNKDLRLIDEADIANRITGYAPGKSLVASVIDTTNKTALARCAQGKLYLIVCMGDKVSIRTLLPTQIRAIAAGHLSLELGDIGVPSLDFRADQSILGKVMGPMPEGGTA
jgi:hypothetical protein